ncbi:hypothetical protein SLEP1_g35674 [Rubroshorea leprosula]|uniref:Uncharacterized protein n=1 Tax=Rubroshorea leprosula TaxID=152421 RepID=A0AAV5KP29_9ROSI|nr:hypothetical protein SLEP1_g35674 [Rubroshorea leprosula]
MADVATVAATAAGKVTGTLIALILNPIWNQITRVFKLEANVKNLKENVRKLEAEKKRVLQFKDDADKCGNEVTLRVNNWLTSSDKYIGEMEKFEIDTDNAKKCFARVCPNPKARYQISKKVEEYLEDIAQLLEEATRIKIPKVRSGTKTPEAIAEDVGAMMSRKRLTEDADDNIDELDMAFSDSSRPLFNEKDKDVEVNSKPNHLLDDSTIQNNPINIEHNGGSRPDEGAKKGGKGQVEGENKKRGGLGSGKWKRLDHNFANSSRKDREKHGKRKLQTTLVAKERALKVLVDNSRVAVTGRSEGHNLSPG